MTAEQLWAEFCSKKNVDINTPYEAWGFGGSGDDVTDRLANLVKEGRKFGTASCYELYELEDELDELPKAGDYSVILDGNDEAVCVIRDYDVYVRPFKKVSPFHAYAEGEGDRSLKYWRDIHKEFFEEEIEETDLSFNEDLRVVCEKFSLEYVPGQDVEQELLYVEPSMEYADEIAAYKKEMLEAGSSFDGCFSMKRHDSIKDYVDDCINWSDPSREADEHGAWGNVILAIRKSDCKMVGCMQVHNVLTDRMQKYTGHVGYSVRPSERRKGYATKMLAKACDFLTSFGFEEIGVSCLPENEASRKTILANGGEYIETVYFEDDKVDLERYKIRLK
ncbi:GNAT family N-acetyltransferase [Butyrivibrio fibrisolvens]|uniref:GNAT family N-acetyltransferase n=1 Tax=Butyrivibrio fibrisolvens TaxID=831 RepID=UPI0003F5BAA6|nr:GNAT family N-acetyltransferase [Butyrivibrio fibrisolvens]